MTDAELHQRQLDEQDQYYALLEEDWNEQDQWLDTHPHERIDWNS